MVRKDKLKIIPLGGLNEIGKNMTVFEYGGQIIIVDCGMGFPEDEMLGIDLVIQDITYLEKNRQKIKGIFLTHGHEDHIGALPYVLKNINVPVYGTKLTLGLVESRLEEHKLLNSASLNVVNAGDTVTMGKFTVEFIAVNHSIADAVALAITTPLGVVVHTGDFKIDCTPIMGNMIDIARLAELGKRGVLALMSDSTNVERAGYTMSERKVGESFTNLFKRGEYQRIIVTTFATNVHRIQQIIDAAVNFGRKVAVVGRSMLNVMDVAMKQGYLNVPPDVLIDVDALHRYPGEKCVILTTGSQGEPMSALYRIAFSDHKKVEIIAGDLIIISANPIPGNEKFVSRVINELFRLGAEVIYESLAEIHVSGHACQEELKLMLGIVKPQYFIPVHGEYRHLIRHRALACSMGIQPQNIFIMENGKVLEIDSDPENTRFNGTVPAGKVLVDGLGVGDVGSIVLRDRKHLAEDGLIIVAATLDSETGMLMSGPDVVSRGFVYVRENEEMMQAIKTRASEVLRGCEIRNVKEWNTIKSQLRDAISNFLYEKTKRRPMILPIIMDA